MALETPNATVAALVLLFDPSAPAGSRVSIRSNTGIKSSFVEGEVTFGGPVTMTYAAFDLDQPVDNDEAVLQPQALGDSFNEIAGCWITPSHTKINATLDALGPYKLVVLIVPAGASYLGQAQAGRLSVSVLKQVTEAAPIAGEPL
jgi:hypothetical protein